MIPQPAQKVNMFFHFSKKCPTDIQYFVTNSRDIFIVNAPITKNGLPLHAIARKESDIVLGQNFAGGFAKQGQGGEDAEEQGRRRQQDKQTDAQPRGEIEDLRYEGSVRQGPYEPGRQEVSGNDRQNQ